MLQTRRRERQGQKAYRRQEQRRNDAGMVEVILRVALRFRLLGSAAGIHLKVFAAHFTHRRRAPTSVTVRPLNEKSWQLEQPVLAWEHARVAESMCAHCYINEDTSP